MPADLLDDWQLALLQCPRDHSALRSRDGQLICAQGHRYPVVDGVPVFLLAEQEQTLGIANASLRRAIANYLEGEREYVDRASEELAAYAPFRKPSEPDA